MDMRENAEDQKGVGTTDTLGGHQQIREGVMRFEVARCLTARSPEKRRAVDAVTTEGISSSRAYRTRIVSIIFVVKNSFGTFNIGESPR
jgi:hypothetical protein